LRRHTLKVGEVLGECAATLPETAVPAIVVTLDSTFIRSCAEGSGIWRCGLAMSKRSPVAARFSALSPKPARTSER